MLVAAFASIGWLVSISAISAKFLAPNKLASPSTNVWVVLVLVLVLVLTLAMALIWLQIFQCFRWTKLFALLVICLGWQLQSDRLIDLVGHWVRAIDRSIASLPGKVVVVVEASY